MRTTWLLPLIIVFLSPLPARAEFIVSSAIIEFTGDGARQQDIELTSRSEQNDYVVSEVYEITNPGSAK